MSDFEKWLEMSPEYKDVYFTDIRDVEDEDLDEYLEAVNYISKVKIELGG